MIHQVKVFKPDGGLKKIISVKKLKRNHWNQFNKNGDLKVNHERGVNTSPKRKQVKSGSKPGVNICAICKTEFPSFNPRKTTCSEECSKKKVSLYQKERYDGIKNGTFVSSRKSGANRKRR